MFVNAPELRAYFEARAGACGDKAQFLGRWHDGRIVGVVAVWNYSGYACEAGWCGERGWLTRAFLQMVFAYIFGQLQCRRITGRINADNVTAIEASARLGFVFEGTMRDAAADGGDVHIVGLLKRDCRYGKF